MTRATRLAAAARAAVVVAGIAAAAALAIPEPVHADYQTTWILEPGPEKEGATKGGAADVKKAQKLAKQKKLREAVEVFERVARAWPSALHDCNLALAYLRAGAYTRAELIWEISALRNADRPSWCTATLGEELSTALRSAGFVPLTIDVAPADAVVTVGGVSMRRMRVVWLAPGHYAIAARADGRADGRVEVDVAAPSAAVSIALEVPRVETEPTPEVPVEAPSPDAGVPGPDASQVATPAEADPIPARPMPAPSAAVPRWPGYAALGVGGVALATGVLFHLRALDAKDAANHVPTDDPRFAIELDHFESRRAVAIGGYAIGAIAVGLGAWWLLDHAAERGPQIGGSIDGNGATVTLGWTLGGP